MTKHRIFAGARLRKLRETRTLNQSQMAGRLGISVSYLSQLEHDDRPLTASVLAALAQHFPIDWNMFEEDSGTRRFAALREAAADPLFAQPLPPEQITRIAEQQPAIADQFIALHGAYRRAEERLQIVDDAMQSGGGRLPWEEVRDWFHLAGNYVDVLDRAAEALSAHRGALEDQLEQRHGVTVHFSDDPALRRFDRVTKRLEISTALPTDSRRFLLAHQFTALELADEIAEIGANADLRSDEARHLLSIGLANYAAGALVMPYTHFRETARAMRHDIDRLCQHFGVSFEQACHRLSTLQRPGERGIPFFFCRVDMAGNITKRHSATRLQFARFGGACPLWIVHEAVAIPDRILVQLAETPDNVRYVSMAKGLVKPSGSYARSPRRYAVALGCEASHAHDFIYADGLDISSSQAATKIGVSCRLCPRQDCDQRAFPPSDRGIIVDPDRRTVVPYQIE
jgi:XRE family transcriptional regulator, fatty acid utilization regulator